jgi:hypothetical protein
MSATRGAWWRASLQVKKQFRKTGTEGNKENKGSWEGEQTHPSLPSFPSAKTLI